MHISAIYQGSSGRIQVFNPYHNEHATVHSSQVQAIPVHQDRLFTASETAASRAVAAADRVRMHLMHPPIAPDYHTRMQGLLDDQELAEVKAHRMQEILDGAHLRYCLFSIITVSVLSILFRQTLLVVERHLPFRRRRTRVGMMHSEP